MRRPQRAGRRISILFVAALIGLGAVAGGVALAETAPRDPGGGGRVIEPGTSIPGEQLPPGDGNPTYRTCDSNGDCPRSSPSCTKVDNADPDSGVITLSICL